MLRALGLRRHLKFPSWIPAPDSADSRWKGYLQTYRQPGPTFFETFALACLGIADSACLRNCNGGVAYKLPAVVIARCPWRDPGSSSRSDVNVIPPRFSGRPAPKDYVLIYGGMCKPVLCDLVAFRCGSRWQAGRRGGGLEWNWPKSPFRVTPQCLFQNEPHWKAARALAKPADLPDVPKSHSSCSSQDQQVKDPVTVQSHVTAWSFVQFHFGIGISTCYGMWNK